MDIKLLGEANTAPIVSHSARRRIRYALAAIPIALTSIVAAARECAELGIASIVAGGFLVLLYVVKE